jgi:hypothetical protein
MKIIFWNINPMQISSVTFHGPSALANRYVRLSRSTHHYIKMSSLKTEISYCSLGNSKMEPTREG